MSEQIEHSTTGATRIPYECRHTIRRSLQLIYGEMEVQRERQFRSLKRECFEELSRRVQCGAIYTLDYHESQEPQEHNRDKSKPWFAGPDWNIRAELTYMVQEPPPNGSHYEIQTKGTPNDQ